MKTNNIKLLLLLLTTAIGSKIVAQINPCSVSKQAVHQQKSLASSYATMLENKYDVNFYHLNVNVERTNKDISGNVIIKSKVLSNTLDTFVFELHPNHIVDSIIINGTISVFNRIAESVFCLLPQTFTQNQSLDATIYYHGTAPSSGNAAIGDGFNNRASPSWGNRATWSLSQPYAAYEWWPCKQQLRDKADSSYCFITTDSTNKAGSNGLLTNVVNLGNGKARYEWKSKYPIDYYLISVAVAEYIDYSFYAHPAGGDSVLVQNYIYNNPATLTQFQTVIDQTDDLIELFTNQFGLYPFNSEKYGHCMAPLSGGMEHQTMTTLGFFDLTLVAHELAHQWFGDNVTCKTWSDIFVNEGFASYSEYLALEALTPNQKAQHMLSVHNNIMSLSGGSIWFTDTANAQRIFDSRLSYDKGSAVIHMLRYEINNDSIFFLALKTYQQLYDKSTATAIEFKNVVENISGKNFDVFFDQWFYGEGFPTFNVRYLQQGNNLKIKNTETASKPSVTPFFKTHLEYLIHRNIGDTIIKLEQTQITENYEFTINGNVTSIELDKDNWVLNKQTAITVDNTLGLANGLEFQNLDITIFPNPSNDVIQILSTSKNLKTLVYNAHGKLVLSDINTKKIDVSGLSKGVYIVECVDEFGTKKYTKFIKN